jgi:hypothetical protein
MRHASEAGVDATLIDRVVGNWSTLEKLRQTVAANVLSGAAPKATINQ